MSPHPERIALLGLDIGTTSCKVICYAANGERIAEAATGYAVSMPRPGWAELDPADVLGAVRQVLAGVAPALGRFERLAMAIAAQGEAFVLVDAAGEPLAPAPVSVDMRGREAIAALNAVPAAARAAREAGQELTSLTSLAKLLWFRDAPDDLLGRTEKALCVGEFVARYFGLVPVMDHSMAARTGLLDVPRRDWSAELLAAAGLPRDLLPAVAPSGSYVGTVPRQRTAELGLSLPIEVYTGGHDQACAMLGAGVTDATTALYSIGTTEAIGVPTRDVTVDLSSLHILPYPHVVEGTLVLLFGSQHGGRVLPWLGGLLGRDGAIVPETPPARPSSLTVVPHMAGTGTVLAADRARATIHGLGYDTTPDELILATLEGVTMEQALGLKRLIGKGFGIAGLRAVGGGARSDSWMQMKADIIGLPIDCLEEPDTACAGAAVLAGLGAGVFASAEEAAGRLVTIRGRFAPRREWHAVYARKLALYEATYRATAGLQPLQEDIEDAVARLDCVTKGIE